jgi:hypothetical protein
MPLHAKGTTLNLMISSILPRRRHRVGAAGAALLASCGLALAHSAPARAAGAYVHQSCAGVPADLSDAYGGWESFMYSISGNANDNQCPWGGLHSVLGPSSTIPFGSAVGWKYTAPANTSITRFHVSYAGATKDFDGVSRGVIQVLNGRGSVGLTYTDSGAGPGNQRILDWTGLNDSSMTVRTLCDGPNGQPGCTGSMGWSSFYYPKIYLSDDAPPVAGATSGSLTTDPALKSNEVLSYSATDEGGGVARLRLYVDGSLSGVDHVVDDFNGHCQVRWTEPGLWLFSHPKPCPGSVNANEVIDTTTIADGQHTLTAKVVDAGQREATLWTATKVVANHPPVNNSAPAYLSPADAGTPQVGREIVVNGDGSWSGPSLSVARSWVQCDANGTIASCVAITGATALSYTPSVADVAHRLRMAVTATNAADSVTVYSAPTGIVTSPSSAETPTAKPTPGVDGADGTNGTNGSSTTTTTTNPGSSMVIPSLPPASSATTIEHTFRGRIVGEPAGTACPQDRATLKFEHVKGGEMKLGFGKASTAQVQLTCTTTGKPIAGAQLDIATKTGFQAAVAADTVTDGAGHATIRLAKGASRAIAVGYRMYADDPIARATASLKVLVTAKLSLKANRRTLRNGRAVTLRGSVAGGLVPKRGVTLAVQWKDGKRWRPFAQIKTSRKGTYAYAYRFTRSSRRVTYTLRVQVAKGQVDYPYVSTVSRAVKVTVAP